MPVIEGTGIESAIAAEAARKTAQEKDEGQANFLKLLVAQLENQDPLNPQDSAAFASQLAQFTSVEQLVAIRAGIDGLGTQLGNNSPVANDSTRIDPTQLVGRDVVVFGSQIEVDEARTPIRMPIRTVEDATEASVKIYDADGVLRFEKSILPVDANGRPIAMRPGDHEFTFDPAAQDLPPGVYAIEFAAKGATGQDVTILPMVEGLVTGAILTGNPAIRIGPRVFSVDDILEVRLPGTSPIGTAGGQTVL